MFKKLFCKHEYKLISSRVSNYTEDWYGHSDWGWWNDNTYVCVKCRKFKEKTVMNKKHICYKGDDK